LMISGFIQAFTASLTVYHSIILLDINWLIACSSLSLAMASNFFAYEFKAKPEDVESIKSSDTKRKTEYMEIGNYRFPKAVMGTDLAILGIIVHLTLMGAFGLCLFTKLSTFDKQTSGCTPSTVQSFLGRDVHVESHSLKKFWLAIYSLAVPPGLNVLMYPLLVILTSLALGIVVNLLVCIGGRPLVCLVRNLWMFVRWCLRMKDMPERDDADEDEGDAKTKGFILMYTFLLVAIDVIIIASLELTIRHNNVQSGDNVWTFGQTLSMILVVPGLWSALGDTWEAIKLRRKGKGDGKDGKEGDEQDVPDINRQSYDNAERGSLQVQDEEAKSEADVEHDSVAGKSADDVSSTVSRRRET